MKSNAKHHSRQHRQAEHIEESYEKRGLSKKKAWSIAWDTVRKGSRGKTGKYSCG